MKAPKGAAIDLASAIVTYTSAGARQLGRVATLKAGMLADFIVLNQKLFDVEAPMMHQLLPTATVVGGRLVSGGLKPVIESN